MTRHPWELDNQVRYQMERIAYDRIQANPLPPAGGRAIARWQRGLGLLLIRCGEHLADRTTRPRRTSRHTATPIHSRF